MLHNVTFTVLYSTCISNKLNVNRPCPHREAVAVASRTVRVRNNPSHFIKVQPQVRPVVDTSNKMRFLVPDLVDLALEVVDDLGGNLVTQDLEQVDPLVYWDWFIRRQLNAFLYLVKQSFNLISIKFINNIRDSAIFFINIYDIIHKKKPWLGKH